LFQVKFAYSRNLGGTMFWSMDQDDFKGEYCNKGQYPLMTAIFKATVEFAPKIYPTGPEKVNTTTLPSTTPIDYRKNHRRNKNGIDYFSERNTGSRNSVGVLGYLIVAMVVFVKALR